MYKGRHVLGKKIVVYDTGEQVGRVRDLIFDHQSNRVLGLLADEGGLFKKPRVVSVEAVQSIGKDSVIVSKKDAIVDAEAFPKMQAILDQENALKNTKITTVNGQDLGTFLDIYFDEHTWDLTGYEVSGGLFADIYSGRSFVPAPLTLKIGEEYAFVENEVMDRMKEHTGGLEATIEATGEKLQALTGATGEKIQAAQRTAGEKLHAIAESTGQQLQKTRQAADSTWQNVADKTTETVQKALPYPSVEQAQGRRVQHAVQTDEGLYIAAPGQIVTEAVIEKARQYGLEAALLEAVGLTVEEAVRTEAKDWLAQSGESLKTGAQKAGERLQEGLKEAKAGTQHLWDKTKERATELQVETTQAIESRRIQNALGRHVNRTILDDQDQVILPEGGVITHEAVEQARAADVLPLLLSSVGAPASSTNSTTQTPELGAGTGAEAKSKIVPET